MKNTDFMNLSLPEGADKIDIEILNSDFTTIENLLKQHAIIETMTLNGEGVIIGAIGPYIRLQNIDTVQVAIDIGKETYTLASGENIVIRETAENIGIITSGNVHITYFVNAKTYADKEFYTKGKIDELLSSVEATVEVDAELSDVSENPVQNKVITQELANYATTAEVESKVVEKVSEIVAGAPERFDTLKELADWIDDHADSAAAMNSAIQKNKTDIATANTAIEKNKTDISTANTNIQKNVDDISVVNENIAINQTTLGTRCKNLLKFKAVAGRVIEVTGLTITINDDYSITATGTLTGESAYNFSEIYLEAGKYRLSSSTPFNIQIYKSGRYVSAADITSDGKIITIAEAGTYSFRWYFGKTGVVVDSTIYPMLTYIDVLNLSYEAYKPSLQEQIKSHEAETKSQATINQMTLGTQCKNLLPYKCLPHSNSGGITVAVADDGVVTLSGTNTVSFTYNINFTTPMVFDRDVFIVGAEKLSNVTYNCKVDTKVNGSNYPSIGTAGLRIPAGTTISYLYFQQQTTNKEIEATVAPMIVYADVLDRTYEPYKLSLQEQINSLIARIEALEGAISTTEGGE